jgi:hypothetical protein
VQRGSQKEDQLGGYFVATVKATDAFRQSAKPASSFLKVDSSPRKS